MIRLSIPGQFDHPFEHLILDYNGTLAIDGILIAGVRKKLRSLAKRLRIHVITADTFGSAAVQLKGLPCSLTIVAAKSQDAAKFKYVSDLGSKRCICVGNGRNDRKMLRAASLGIAVIQKEGAAFQTMAAADVVCQSILDALEMLEYPKRLIATLRS